MKSMGRVPDHPPRPIQVLQDFLDAGMSIRSYCSSGKGHHHVVVLSALIDERGPDTLVDYAFKRSLICPECGAPGGGIEFREG